METKDALSVLNKEGYSQISSSLKDGGMSADARVVKMMIGL